MRVTNKVSYPGGEKSVGCLTGMALVAVEMALVVAASAAKAKC
jgi:hypothetical protein